MFDLFPKQCICNIIVHQTALKSLLELKDPAQYTRSSKWGGGGQYIIYRFLKSLF